MKNKSMHYYLASSLSFILTISSVSYIHSNSIFSPTFSKMINDYLLADNNSEKSEQNMEFILQIKGSKNIAKNILKNCNEYFSHFSVRTPSSQDKNYFTIMDLPYDASQSMIEEKYISLKKETSDKEKLRDIEEAFSFLKDTNKRQHFIENNSEVATYMLLSDSIEKLFTKKAEFIHLLWDHRLHLNMLVKMVFSDALRHHSRPILVDFFNQPTYDPHFFTKHITSIEALRGICSELELFTSAIEDCFSSELKKKFNQWLKASKEKLLKNNY